MPDSPVQGNRPSVKEARADYQNSKKARRKAKHSYVVAKHLARKLKHRLERAIDRRKKSKGKHSENEIRDGIVDYAFWGVHNEPQIGYAQVRPYPSNPRQLPQNTDCSGFTTNAAKDAGAEDPNGSDFDGYGFTGTQYEHCPKVSLDDLKVGDSLEHGGYPGSHINIVVDVGSRTISTVMVVSHGQSSGPALYPASVEISAHAGQSYFWLKTV